VSESTPRPHVANIDFPVFYASAFGNDEGRAREFYESLKDRTAKIVLHQAARMLWLGDAVDKVSRGRPALQILFFMIAAEAVAKLANAYEGESDSRKYAKQFFLTICSEDHRRLLGKAFRDPTGSSGGLSPAEAVDFLYDVRCDVVHRGQYFMLHLPRPELEEEDMLISWKGKSLIATITAAQLRQIVLEGAVREAKELSA